MVGLFDTYVLNRVVDNMPDRTSFLVDLFFPEVQVSEEETVLFDTTNGRKLITPFVSPLVEGPMVQAIGYETDSFRPAYAKDKRVFNPAKSPKRLPGETIGGGALTREQRYQRAIKANMNEQIEMLGGRLEVMAADVLTTGKATISGERYPTRVIDFKRRANNTQIRVGAGLWTDANPTRKPVADIEYEAQELSDATGYMPTDVIFSPEAWALYKDDLLVNHKDEIDTTLKNLVMPEIALGYVNQPRDGVVYRGRNGYLRFWTYTGTYTSPEDGSTIRMLPVGGVIIASPVDGVRHFGAILDEDAGIQARQYFVKSWVEPDPSRRFLLMQAAPLLVPYRRDNAKYLKVL
jgi:hypothetical protein